LGLAAEDEAGMTTFGRGFKSISMSVVDAQEPVFAGTLGDEVTVFPAQCTGDDTAMTVPSS
jgi:hypothetical protein